MEELIIGTKSIKVDVSKISQSLFEMHKQKDPKLVILKFGMLDAEIIQSAEENLRKYIYQRFSRSDLNLFKDRIDRFLSDCNHKIGVGIYSLTDMVV